MAPRDRPGTSTSPSSSGAPVVPNLPAPGLHARAAHVGGPPPRVLVTAGPTHEPIDAVRFIGNRSSGRMGLAIAEAAAARGCQVSLLMGPATIQTTAVSGIEHHRFRTTADLQASLAELWPAHELLVMAAAVADYRPAASLTADTAESKMRRREGPLVLALESTPDLLAGVAAASRSDQTLVGFALEPPDRLLDSARDKLVRKGVHAIVANPLETMDGEDIAGTLVTPDGLRRPPTPRSPKSAFAAWLIDELLALHAGRTAAAS